MCVVSNMGDMYRSKFTDPYWNPSPQIWPPVIIDPPSPSNPIVPDSVLGLKLKPEVTREEFEALRKMVEEMRDVLVVAKKYDEETGQPDCEMDDKVAVLKRVAEIVGVDLSKVFGNK